MLFVDQLLLDFSRQPIPHLVGPVGRIQQEHRPVHGVLEHVDPLQELELMAGDEPRLRDQIRRPDRTRARAQVRDRRRAGLLRVVDEIPLDVQAGLFPDDLDRVLVGADGAVGAEAVEHRGCDVGRLDVEGGVVSKRRVCHIVHDADGEMILRTGLCERVEDRLHHPGRELFGRQTVSPSHDDRFGGERRRTVGSRFGEGGDHVLIQRLADRARFLGAIHHGDRFDGSG